MGIRELRKEASRLGIKYSGLKKAELEPLVAAALANETLPSKGDTSIVQPAALNVLGCTVVGNDIDGEPAVNVLAGMDKGDARKLRKALRAAGRTDLASLDIRKATSSRVAA